MIQESETNGIYNARKTLHSRVSFWGRREWNADLAESEGVSFRLVICKGGKVLL